MKLRQEEFEYTLSFLPAALRAQAPETAIQTFP